MLELIAEIERLLPPHWIWLVRAIADDEDNRDFGEYFANIVSPRPTRLRYTGYAHTPLQALQNAFDGFIEGEKKRGRLQ